jgi:hypothetical protein
VISAAIGASGGDGDVSFWSRRLEAIRGQLTRQVAARLAADRHVCRWLRSRVAVTHHTR